MWVGGYMEQWGERCTDGRWIDGPEGRDVLMVDG